MEERNKGTLGDDFAIQSLKDPQGSLRNFQILTLFLSLSLFPFTSIIRVHVLPILVPVEPVL